MLTTTAANRLRYQLLDIPDLCALLAEDLVPSASRSSGMPSARRTHPQLGAREDVLSLLGPAPAGDVHDPYGDQTGSLPVASTLSAWCEVVWGFPCPDIPTAVGILLRHHTEAAAADYAQDYADEVNALHRQLTTLAGTRNPPMSIRCPMCGKRSLEHDPGRVYGYRCVDLDCSNAMTADRYDQLAEQHITLQQATRAHQQAERARQAQQLLDNQTRRDRPSDWSPTMTDTVPLPYGEPPADHAAEALRLLWATWEEGRTEANTAALTARAQVHATLALTQHLAQPAAAPGAVDLVLYQAVYKSIPLGLYTNRGAARAHCEHDAADSLQDHGALSWVRDAGHDQEEELHSTSPLGHTYGLDYWVNTVTAPAAFDPNAEG